MTRLLTALVAVFLCLIVPAKAWEVADMNATVNQVNFVVGSGCSGTLIDLERRLILTNYHCVDSNVRVVTVQETQLDGTIKEVKRVKLETVDVSQKAYADYALVGSATYVADLVAWEKRQDLALLQMRREDIPHTMQAHMPPNGVELMRGETVYIVGNPLGLDATIGVGVISSLNRTFEFAWTNGTPAPMIQHSAGSAGGNSGGSLFSFAGYLIGVPSAGARNATHIGLAIPLVTIKAFLTTWCYAGIFDPEADEEACRTAGAPTVDEAASSGDTEANALMQRLDMTPYAGERGKVDCRRQASRIAAAAIVLQPSRSQRIVAVHPVPQRLSVHAADPGGLGPAHPVQYRRNRQQATALVRIPRTCSKPTKLRRRASLIDRYGSWHGRNPPCHLESRSI